MKRTPKFSKTIPSEAAKNANTCEMKCFSSGVSFSQCFKSSCKSTSSVRLLSNPRERERERERESVKGERLIFEISTRDIREEQRYERRKKDEEGRRED